ncbi:MAG: 5-formyltetrahydrofolate cyclo-ligase [Bosea sp. (in: a-proteobacteria)]
MTDAALKATVRAAAITRRDALEIDDRLEWDQAIAEHLLASGLLDAVTGVVAAYWPMRSEADPRPVLLALKERDVPTALPAMVPRSDGQGREIEFRSWSPWEPIVPGGFGTLVPQEGAAIVQPACLIVPLLAFDASCRRLGYGKGHYDRAIAALKQHRMLITIGIAYAAQQIEVVPIEPHDEVLDAIVTENGVLRREASA